MLLGNQMLLGGQERVYPSLAHGLPTELRAGGAERSLGSAALRDILLGVGLDLRTLDQHNLWL